jgi:hypothetical protein
MPLPFQAGTGRRLPPRAQSLRKDSDLPSLTSATPDQQQAAFDELSPTYLKPIYDKMNGALTYDELKILRLMYLTSNQE